MKSFTEKVHEVVKGIPKGKVLTYGEVARNAGNSKAVRAVGTILRKNFNPDIPCHRVIRADGRVGNYNRGGEEVKKRILRKEGYEV